MLLIRSCVQSVIHKFVHSSIHSSFTLETMADVWKGFCGAGKNQTLSKQLAPNN